MANKKLSRNSERAVIRLERTTDALTRKDIADWRAAWQAAINADHPSRQRLYDIYRDVEADGHLSGCIGQRKGYVKARSFKLVDDAGSEDGEALHYFDQQWFKDLVDHILDSRYWGHSLVELGDIAADGDGCPTYRSVTLIPRKHVIPERGRVIQDLGQDWTSGIDYHAAPWSEWLIEAGRPDDLGLFLKAAQHTIPKKNNFAFWDTFAEIFGMPMRIARTTSRDDKELARMERMMDGMGAKAWGIFQQGTDIEVVANSQGDAFNVYDKRIERADRELSKLIIGQTMTIEDGSSRSQSETHLEVFEHLVDQDADLVRDVVNNQLLPRMVRHGFPVAGLRFEWDDAVDYSPEQQRQFEEMLLRYYHIAPKHFQEKYGTPILGARTQPAEPTPDDKPGSSRFFD